MVCVLLSPIKLVSAENIQRLHLGLQHLELRSVVLEVGEGALGITQQAAGKRWLCGGTAQGGWLPMAPSPGLHVGTRVGCAPFSCLTHRAAK